MNTRVCCSCCAYAVKPIPIIIRILEMKTTRLKLTTFIFISLIEGIHV